MSFVIHMFRSNFMLLLTFFLQYLLWSCTKLLFFFVWFKMKKKKRFISLCFYFRPNASKSCRRLWFAEQEVPLVTSWGRHRTDDMGESICWVCGDTLGHSKCWLIPHLADFPRTNGNMYCILEMSCDKYIFYVLSIIWTQGDIIIFLHVYRYGFNFPESFSAAY